MKDLLLHNWHLKLISLGLAAVLWAEVARTPTSEIGMSVALEYQNMPEKTDFFGDTGDRVDRVEVRLRGPSASLRTITAQDISFSIDMRNVTPGQEKVIPLSPEMVSAPFGVEVVRVFPARVRLTVEPIQSKPVRIVATRTGSPAEGFVVDAIIPTPDTVEIEGPASHVSSLETVTTSPVNVDGKDKTFSETVELDIQDPVIQLPRPTPVSVEIRILPKTP